jgi:cytochrome c oxidase subunit III
VGSLEERPQLDVSGLPTVVFGPRAPIWMANLGYMAIEGTMFALLIVSYFYYRTRATAWPPEQDPPRLLFGTINLVLFILSVVPNELMKRAARRGQLVRTGALLGLMILIGVATLIVRGLEFPALNCRWSENAYGSIVWALIVLHTGHLLTEWIETLVVTAVLVTGHTDGQHFVDVEQTANYWNFVVLFWIALYLVIYIAPRGL